MLWHNCWGFSTDKWEERRSVAGEALECEACREYESGPEPLHYCGVSAKRQFALRHCWVDNCVACGLTTKVVPAVQSVKDKPADPPKQIVKRTDVTAPKLSRFALRAKTAEKARRRFRIGAYATMALCRLNGEADAHAICLRVADIWRVPEESCPTIEEIAEVCKYLTEAEVFERTENGRRGSVKSYTYRLVI